VSAGLLIQNCSPFSLLKELADKSGRTVPKEAEQAIKNWLQLHGKLPQD